MTKQYEMPPRQTIDGAVAVSRPDLGWIGISVMTNGREERVTMSEYNAWRIFGLLSVMLELPLSKAINKAIKLDGPPGGPGLEVKLTRDLPADAPLGAKVAARLADRAMARTLREQGHAVEETATGLTVSPMPSDTTKEGT